MRTFGLWISLLGMVAVCAAAAEEPCHDTNTTTLASKAATQPLSRADELDRAGAEAFKRGDFQSAIIAWEQASQIYRARGAIEP